MIPGRRLLAVANDEGARPCRQPTALYVIALVEKGNLDGLTHAGEQLTPSSLAVCLQGATRSACCNDCVSGEN
jgi:hypothetical protein